MTTEADQLTQESPTQAIDPPNPPVNTSNPGAQDGAPADATTHISDASTDAAHAASVEAATGRSVTETPDKETPAQDSLAAPVSTAESTPAATPVTPAENTPVAAPVAAAPNPALVALKPKQELSGKVTRIELYGAFIDVGVGHDGLLHISQISEEHVRNVHDKLAIAQEVTVWVRSVDVEHGRIDLTMIKPSAMSWDELRAGQEVTGRVVQIEKYGVFLDIGAERPGLIHVSELANEYVKSPSDVVKMGEELRARVLKVSAKKRQIDLSVKALFEQPSKAEVVEDDDLKNLPTAMELAMRNAIQGTDMADQLASFKPTRSQPNRVKKDKPQRQQQTEIAMRTLQNRPK